MTSVNEKVVDPANSAPPLHAGVSGERQPIHPRGERHPARPRINSRRCAKRAAVHPLGGRTNASSSAGSARPCSSSSAFADDLEPGAGERRSQRPAALQSRSDRAWRTRSRQVASNPSAHERGTRIGAGRPAQWRRLTGRARERRRSRAVKAWLESSSVARSTALQASRGDSWTNRPRCTPWSTCMTLLRGRFGTWRSAGWAWAGSTTPSRSSAPPGLGRQTNWYAGRPRCTQRPMCTIVRSVGDSARGEKPAAWTGSPSPCRSKSLPRLHRLRRRRPPPRHTPCDSHTTLRAARPGDWARAGAASLSRSSAPDLPHRRQYRPCWRTRDAGQFVVLHAARVGGRLDLPALPVPALDECDRRTPGPEAGIRDDAAESKAADRGTGCSGRARHSPQTAVLGPRRLRDGLNLPALPVPTLHECRRRTRDRVAGFHDAREVKAADRGAGCSGRARHPRQTDAICTPGVGCVLDRPRRPVPALRQAPTLQSRTTSAPFADRGAQTGPDTRHRFQRSVRQLHNLAASDRATISGRRRGTCQSHGHAHKRTHDTTHLATAPRRPRRAPPATAHPPTRATPHPAQTARRRPDLTPHPLLHRLTHVALQSDEHSFRPNAPHSRRERAPMR